MLPYELRDEFVKGNIVLFVGSGFVRNYLPTMPLWPDLLQRVFSSLNGDQHEIFNYCEQLRDGNGNPVIPSGEYLRLAQKFELARESKNRHRRNVDGPQIPGIHEQVRRSIHDSYDVLRAQTAVHNSSLMRAKTLPITIWVTTNYDTFLEDTVLAEGIQNKAVAVLKRPVQNLDFGQSAGARQTLFKIHGCVQNEPEKSIVITEEDYYRFLRQDKYLLNKLYTLFCERTIVFLGYGLNDPNIQFIYHEVLFDQKTLSELGEKESFSQFRPAFFVTERAPTEQDRAYYRHKRIRYVSGYSIERFFGELLDTFEREQRRRADVTEAIRQEIAEYQPIYQQLNWDTNPNAIQVQDDDKRDYIAKVQDLVEFYEVVYRRLDPSQPALVEFDPARGSGVVEGAFRIIDLWCRAFLTEDRTDILESVLEFMEKRLTQHRRGIFKRFLDKVITWLNSFNGLRGLTHFIGRYLVMLMAYDRDYNDWDDYQFCLEQYTKATRLFAMMAPAQKAWTVRGLYEQLRMCGRDIGDSWYTTNAVYSIWGQFDVTAWPPLEAEIRKDLPGLKQDAMLEHLKPGADYTQFLPRRRRT
jgi:hypothetical protein